MNSKAFNQLVTDNGSESSLGSTPNLKTNDFQVGEWIVRPQLNELQHHSDGTTRHLEPRLAKLLCYLAAHADQVVERDTLVSVLWPRVIVNENSLTRAVSELRKQLNTDTNRKLVYIETIPKRGYRLRLPIEEIQSVQQISKSESSKESFASSIPLYKEAKQSVAAAMCLSLVLAAWLQAQNSNSMDSVSLGPWSDELVMTETIAALKDEIVLSSKDLADTDNERITQPVLSQNEYQFAYIQYDHTGSTLFLGQINGDFEPVPVFNSMDILYNLAWSPIGNALIFASKPALTPALYDNKRREESILYSFDLDSFRLSRLVEKSPDHQSPLDTSEMSLT